MRLFAIADLSRCQILTEYEGIPKRLVTIQTIPDVIKASRNYLVQSEMFNQIENIIGSADYSKCSPSVFIG